LPSSADLYALVSLHNRAPSYADLTRCDPNPLKRLLQRRRLADALRLTRDLTPEVVVDYGGGDGALLVAAAGWWPRARLICFEPAPQLAAEARDALRGLALAEVVEAEAALPSAAAQLVFCTEVFEHLPPAETACALVEIERILASGGRLVLGVPVELGPPALAKGLFRASRRPGDFDGRLGNVLAAGLGRPPGPRPAAEISPGRAYHPHHAGFDHRPLLEELGRRFRVERLAGSPFPALPPWANSELYLRACKA
jgi:SAM-dependent methyltransferase